MVALVSVLKHKLSIVPDHVKCHASSYVDTTLFELPETSVGLKGIRTTKIKKYEGTDGTPSENTGQDKGTLISTAVNKFQNLYQLVFILDEKLTEREYTECQNTVDEVIMSSIIRLF